MSFKQALFLGGAVLVLAACSNAATGPDSAMRKGGSASSVKVTATDTTNAGGPTTRTLDTECRSGWLQSSGRDSTCVVEQ